MLQHLAGGRVDLMLGRGNTGPVYPWFGQDIRNGIAARGRELRPPAPTLARGRGRLAGPLPDAADRLHRPRPGRSTASRRSCGTAPSAARRSRSRPRSTATASSTTTSSGRPSTPGAWSTSTAGASSTTATARPTTPSSASAARCSCATTPRPPIREFRPYFDQAPVYGGGPSLEDYMDADAAHGRQPAAGHRPHARASARSSATTSASCSSSTTPACRCPGRAGAAGDAGRRGRAGAAHGVRQAMRSAGHPGGTDPREPARGRRGRGGWRRGGCGRGPAVHLPAYGRLTAMATRTHRGRVRRGSASRRPRGCSRIGWRRRRVAALEARGHRGRGDRVRGRATTPRTWSTTC